jgi:hypothetical protein
MSDWQWWARLARTLSQERRMHKKNMHAAANTQLAMHALALVPSWRQIANPKSTTQAASKAY